MVQNQKYRINNLAKDFNLKSKDIVELLASMGYPGKTHMAVLESEEFNLVIDRLTAQNPFENIDGYLKGQVVIEPPVPKEKEEPKPEAAKEQKPETKPEAAAKPAEEPKPEAAAKPAEEPKPKNRPEAAAKPAEEPKPEVRPERKGESRPEPKEEARPAQKPDAQGQGRMQGQKNNGQPQRPNVQNGQSQRPNNAQSSQPQRPNNAQSGQPQRPNNVQSGQPQRPNNAQSGQPQRPNSGQSGQNQRPGNAQNAGQRSGNPQTVRAEGPKKPQDTEPRKPVMTQNEKFEQKYQNKPIQPQPKQKQKVQPKTPARPQPVISGKSEVNTNVQSERSPHISGTRVVDTRSNTVDLEKYDERLETLVPEMAKNVNGEKQKLKKQNNKYDRERDKERMAMEKLKKQELEKARKAQLQVMIPDEIQVGELAQRLKATAANVIKKLMSYGVMASVNQVVDFDTAALIAEDMGAKVNREVVVTIEEKLFEENAQDNETTLVPRAPVVVVMGHVDHGKTSLLDAIRHTNVTSGEAGGITQHIGAYRVNINGQDITFLDTPGHEAFTAMRARGAKATDIAILVVAADDGIMPQTIEAINHAKAAGVDIIVAINKMDKYGADPDKIKQDLTKYDLVPEEWGGDVICVPVSAVTGMGIDSLLENVLLVAEMKELKANPNRRAKGVVIEAKLDKGRGPVATVLVQNGTLRSGDVVIAGTSVGRVRVMTNDRGQTMKEAGPSVPVEIVGLAEVPGVGDEFNAVEDERMARELADQRRSKMKEDEFKANSKVSLDDLFAQISEGAKELNIIVKADVGGSAEAVKQSLEKLSNEEVKVRVIHAAVGGITEGDVMFAAASNAIIVGFNVRPDKSAIDSAERQKVDIRTYRIIYDCIEEIKAALSGMLAPTFRENLLGHVEVRQTIHVPNVGTIAGSYVQDGKVVRSAQIRVLRDGVVIFEDKISSLRRFKDDVREVAQGYECGIGLERFNDIKVGDILEVFEMEEIKKEL